MDTKQSDQYSPDETKQRMENALRRALNTPPKTHKEITHNGKRVSKAGKSRVKKTR